MELSLLFVASLPVLPELFPTDSILGEDEDGVLLPIPELTSTSLRLPGREIMLLSVPTEIKGAISVAGALISGS